MNSLNSFSKEESARRVHNIGCCHSASHQFTNHTSRQFIDDTCPSGHRSEHYKNEAEYEDLCVVCGWVSANEFFSFPNDVNTQQQWATFCDLPFDKIKPHFRLCDRHFKPDDYRISIQSKLLIQTSSVPTLQPKLKHGFGPSTNNSLQSSQNSKNISNTTLNENTSKNAIYSPVVQGNLKSEIFRLRTGCLLLENTVAELKKGIERLDERCFVEPAEIDKNIAKDTRDRTAVNSVEGTHQHQSLITNDDPCNTNIRLSEQHSEKESIEKVADEDGYSTDSSMPPLEIPNDEPHTLEGPLETFSEEEGSRYLAKVARSETSRNVAEDNRNTDFSSKDLRSCFFKSTKATDDVFLNILDDDDDDEVANGISVSPQINCQLRSNDTSASSYNEKFDKAHAGQTLRTEQVQVATQQPNCNDDELNMGQRNKQASPSAGGSKRRKNGGEGKITRSLKKKKELPGVASTIQPSGIVSKTARGVLMRDSPPYCCNICDETFSDKSDWTRHQKTHSKPFLCSKCKKSFAYKSDLLRHQASHGENRPYKCDFCDARFKQNKDKLRHERYMHTEVVCFECAVCGKMFNHKPSLVRHLRIHSGIKPFRCQSCGTSFSEKQSLTRHQRTHSKERSFKCRICEQLFKYRHNKARGVLMRDSPPYRCDICNKKFSNKSDWRRHQQEQSKPFVCPKCKKPFARKYHLIKHQATHTEMKPYKCDICDARFKHNHTKLQHERRYMHTKVACFECAVCGKMFNHKNSIMIHHLLVHSDQKPFCCQTCGTSFPDKISLIVHQWTHSKKKKLQMSHMQ